MKRAEIDDEQDSGSIQGRVHLHSVRRAREDNSDSRGAALEIEHRCCECGFTASVFVPRTLQHREMIRCVACGGSMKSERET